MKDANAHGVDTLEGADIWFRSLAHPLQARLEMIRQHYLTRINDMILEEENWPFRDTDFSVVFKNEQTDQVLEITYRYEPKYAFTARMPLVDEVVTEPVYAAITASPGKIFDKEATASVNAVALEDHIRAWLQRLDDELSSIPVQRQLEEQQQEIDKLCEQLGNIPKDYFSRQEAEYLKGRLDDLEARLTENLRAATEDQTELQTKIDEISNDMSALKDNIDVLNKRGWAKALVTRTFEWAKDPVNRKLLKSGSDVAKDLLLEAGKHLPDN